MGVVGLRVGGQRAGRELADAAACLLISSVSIFVSGLSVPHAFGDEGTLFAVSYAVVRFLHLALYVDASRRGNAAWSAIAGFAVTVAIGMALLIAGSFATGAARIVLWVLAAAIDYAGPAWLTRERLRGLQRVAVAHFAERYSLFVIICLGESIVAIGVGALGPRADRLADRRARRGGGARPADHGRRCGGRTSRVSPRPPRSGCAGTRTRCWPPPTPTAICTW